MFTLNSSCGSGVGRVLLRVFSHKCVYTIVCTHIAYLYTDVCLYIRVST